MLVSVVVALATLATCLDLPHGARGRGEFSLAAAGCPPSGGSADSVTVYPMQQFVHYGSPSVWSFFDDYFMADTVAGWRYVVELVKGAPGVSNAIITVNGQQFVGSNDFTATRLLRAIDATAGQNNMVIAIKGTNGSSMDMRVVRVKDPTFKVFGDTTHVYAAAGGQRDTFAIPAGARPPYTLRLINGAPDGTNRLTSARLKINGTQVLSSSDFGSGKAVITRQVSLLTGNSDSLYNDINAAARATLRYTATDSSAALIALTSPGAETLLTEADTIHVAGTVTDETPGWLRVNTRAPIAIPGSPLGQPAAFDDAVPLPADGRYPLSIQAINSACLATTMSRLVIRDRLVPSLSVSWPTAQPATVDSAEISIQGYWADTTQTIVTVDGDVIGTGTGGTFSYKYPLDLGPNRVWCRAVDALGHKTEFLRVVYRATPNEPTPPSVNAPALSNTGITSFASRVKFLHTGASPVDSGVVSGSLDSLLVAVVHGRVVGRDYGPLPNVYVSVLGHPEYGQTRSRADGQFDLVVNGGAQLTLRFTKSGYLELQRQVEPPPNDFVNLEDVAMIGKTVKRTVVDMNAAMPIVVRSRFATDANGDRDIRLFVQSGTAVKVSNPGNPGDTALFQAVRLRATEFTIGPDGQRAMPGVLPPTSAYTYCVDLTADEADSMTATGQPAPTARFTQPVAVYVKGILHLPVGASVPVGYYDRTMAKWMPGKDGVVVKIVGASGDTALIDSNGDGSADAQSRLDSLGVTTTELRQLKAQYAMGDTLWRMSVDHFTVWDFNFNLATLLRALANAFGRFAQWLKLLASSCHAQGSIVECENRVLGEEIPIVGSALSLHYRSFRAPGDSAIRTVRIPVLGDTVPTDLNKIIVHLDVAGQRVTRQFGPPFTTPTVVSLPWNGLDVFGRQIEGSATARLSIGYQYSLSYMAGSGGNSLGNPNASGALLGPATGDRSVGRTTWTRSTISVGAPSTGSDGLGGWTLSPHHVYDPNGQGAISFGDGSVELGERIRPVRTSHAGNQLHNIRNTGVAATSTSVNPADMAIGPDGSLYFTDNYRGAVLRVDRSGFLTSVAGKQFPGVYSGDTAIAGHVTMRNLRGLAVSPEGLIYVGMQDPGRICRITPGGGIKTICGGVGASVTGGGDGGPASAATLVQPHGLALGPDGSLFVVEYGGTFDIRLRRIAPDGTITTYAGKGQTPGDDYDLPIKATDITLRGSMGLAVDAEGNVYLAEPANHRVRKIAPDGILTSFAVLPADRKPEDIAFAADGSLNIMCSHGQNGQVANEVRRRDPDGTLSVIGGGGQTDGEGIPVSVARFVNPLHIATAPDGSYFVADIDARLIFRVGSSLPSRTAGEFKVPSPDGAEVYFFDQGGRHLRTRDALTGAVLYRFEYDAEGRLVAVHDANNDTTRIERNAGGEPIAIVAPYGQRTALTLDANGYLATATDPANQTHALVTRSDGLLSSFSDPEGHQTTFSWDAEGRLEKDTDAAGGFQRLDKTESGLARIVTRTTKENRTTTYTVTDLLDGTLQRRVVGPDNLLSYMSDSTDAKVRTWAPEGVQVTSQLASAPRFFMLSPLVASSTRLTGTGPGQITTTVEHGQTTDPTDPGGFDPPFVHGTFQDSARINGRPWATTTFISNPASRTLWSRTPEHRVTATTVDSAGRPAGITAPGVSPIAFGYDNRGRLELVQQGGRGLRYGFDARGRLATIRDTLGRMTAIQYDGADRESVQTFPDGRQVRFGYDRDGNLTSLTPPGRPAHGFSYTPVDLQSAYTPPVVSGVPSPATTYDWNQDRQLTAIHRPDGASVTFGYDGAGRLATVTQPRGTGTLSYYAGTGTLAQATSPDTVTVTYTHLGPLVTKEEWTGRIAGMVEHTYNAELGPATQLVNGTQSVTFGYDHDGLLIQAGALSIHRRADNGLEDSTAVASSSMTSSADYSSAGELANLRYAYSGSTLFLESLSRDAVGRIVGLSETVQGVTKAYGYRYDAAGRLYGVTTNGDTTARYLYDANGNRLSFANPQSAADTATAEYDHQDRLLRYADTTYTYTAAGELSRKVLGSDTTLYTYDLLGNLITVVLPNQTRLDYVIDGQNRRVGRKVNGALVQGWLFEDGLRPVAELDSAGSVVARYVWGSRANVPDYVVKGGTTYRILADHLGSVRLVVNVDNGAVERRAAYDAYGRVVEDTNRGFMTLGYAGGITDTSTGLVRFGARDHDPAVGRWLSKDPVVPGHADANAVPRHAGQRGIDGIWLQDGEVNLYAYVDNGPIGSIDPLGMYKTKAGVPPPSPRIDQLLRCIETRMGIDLFVTSTSEPTPRHPKGTPHRRGEAVDIRYPRDPGQVLCAAAACGAGYAQDEKLRPSPRSSAPHIHLQIPPGRKGGRGDLPCKTCGDK